MRHSSLYSFFTWRQVKLCEQVNSHTALLYTVILQINVIKWKKNEIRYVELQHVRFRYKKTWNSLFKNNPPVPREVGSPARPCSQPWCFCRFTFLAEGNVKSWKFSNLWQLWMYNSAWTGIITTRQRSHTSQEDPGGVVRAREVNKNVSGKVSWRNTDGEFVAPWDGLGLCSLFGHLAGPVGLIYSSPVSPEPMEQVQLRPW